MKNKRWINFWSGIVGVALVVALTLSFIPIQVAITEQGLISMGLSKVRADPSWLSGYDYRQTMNISRPSGAVNNHTMMLTVYRTTGSSSGSKLYLNDHPLNWTGTVT